MGRCVESPVVKLKGQGPPAPRLLWEPVKKGREDGGEILVAFELFLVRSGVKTVNQNVTVSVRCSLHTSPSDPRIEVVIPSSSLPLPRWETSPSHGYPRHFTSTLIHSERHWESKVSCPRKQRRSGLEPRTLNLSIAR